MFSIAESGIPTFAKSGFSGDLGKVCAIFSRILSFLISSFCFVGSCCTRPASLLDGVAGTGAGIAGFGVRGVVAVVAGVTVVVGETLRFFLSCVLLALQTARILLFCSRLPDETDVPEEIVSAADDAEDLRDPALEVLGEPAAEDLRDPAADDFFELPREEGAGV